MKKTLLNMFAMGAILSITMISACSDDDDNGWTDAQRQELVSDCTSDGNTTENCECFVNGVTEEFSYDEINNLGEDDIADAFTIIGIASDCNIIL